jgi:16S rRNA (guanine966-N2)-methyltransferase
MRIIAGQRRGHKIDGPRPTADLQPTSDFVRESLFNMVGGLMDGRFAVDLFAGTGAIGLEALSRGAEHAVFVERDREAVALIHRNIARLRYEDRTSVRLSDAYRWARGFRPVDDRPHAVFLDPPYRDAGARGHRVTQLVTALLDTLPPGSLIVLEAGRELEADVLPDLDAWDIRRYGDTRIAIRLLPDAVSGPRGVGDAQEGGEGDG